MFNHVAIALMTSVSATPALPQTASPAATPPAPTAAAAPAEKRICRRDPVLGSNLTKKTCRTKAEWAAIGRAYRDQTDRLDGMSRARQSNGMVVPD